VLDLREHGSQRERVGSGLVGGHRVWRHPRVLESGTKERCRGAPGIGLPRPARIRRRRGTRSPSARRLSHTFHRRTSVGRHGIGVLSRPPDTKEQTSAPSRTRWKNRR
jgi:hypothetical protein